MVIRDLRSAAILVRWPLPGAVRCQPYDKRWGLGPLALVQNSTEAGRTGEPGVLLVDASTGETRRVELDNLARHTGCEAGLSEWSSRAQILVECSFAEADGCSVSLVNATGHTLRSARFPEARASEHECWALWAPDSTRAALLLSSSVWVWTPDNADAPVRCWQAPVDADTWVVFAWGVDSSWLVIVQGEDPVLHFWTLQQGLQVVKIEVNDAVVDCVWSVFSGHGGHIALLCDVSLNLSDDTTNVSGALVIFQYIDRQLLCVYAGIYPSRTVSYHCPDTGAPVSPNGRFIALPAVRLGSSSQHSIDIIEMTTGHLLLRTAVTGFSPCQVTWAADGASLLVSEGQDCCRLLLDFA